MKKIVLSSAALIVASYTQIASAAIIFGETNVKDGVKGTTETADQAVQTLITRAITFLYIVGVVYGLYGGFQILTAGGDEEKVKKGKTIIIQALIGLVVIFLASSIITWLIKLIFVTT